MTNKTVKRQKVTASDVAARAGVSKWTVSRAFIPDASISEKARKKIMAIARELGYRPNLLARGLSQKRTHIIGVAVDELKNPHSMLMLDEVTRQLQKRGYMALLLNITGDNYYAVMSLADQLQVDGILFLGTVLTPEFVAIAVEMHDIPLIQVCRNTGRQEIDIVDIDGYQAGRVIARLLTEQGHKRFGYMSGPGGGEGHLTRKQGFRDELCAQSFGLELELNAEHYDRQMSYNLVRQYLLQTSAPERIEALFCENDVLALGAMEALRDAGHEPAIAVVGFDDIDEASAPGWQLTTYSQRLDLLMEEALNRLISGNKDSDGNWRSGELRIRRSHIRQ
ncbi:LacI family DNA-binding transcriptional regulator [Pantoea agglomerans]|jgi:DNA-binding LacI/PurR family transcriptional regulator|uniref:LacI family DNA-binding transcriptional regulator n=1 Tax=Enterobacter agglomerans TaxID=549 RepID=UPI0010097944|nr:LacI family DNA-binding transcriptional regulator [Pantoea agglomerans]QAV47566.1 LacI family transcriptional regulator [Pantoea agglomerans]QAV52229.1 LacI family transcriptional regulator [Pantoea agglomerans]WNK42371.1 LacI family DNA-binding transcriptional regulator [Pantoea agglomerans]WNK51328.1 LacI family DNA-binding transcriptional regulator [Pantoea agglomerans]